MVAKKLTLISDFGGQLDSLADALNFCAIPAAITYAVGYRSWWLLTIAALYLLCGVWRLALYNVAGLNEDGAIWLAEQANVSIVPVGLQGFYRVWPRHRVLPWVARCTIKIGKPSVLETNFDVDRQTRRKQLKKLLMDRIGTMIEQC